MANEIKKELNNKPATQKTDVKVEAKAKAVSKVEKTPVLTIAKVFQIEGVKQSKTRDVLADNILATFKAKGITHNKKGKEIKKERVLQQISAMTRDIKNERGSKNGSWWSKYTVVEDEKGYKLVLKN